ncbi:MAG TPA: glycosyltransferase family 61 protein [Lacisediminihabitans sp.]|uniref:glycosyltransferase family 61 protein n=1 Tax=Lacisediminihabitans sp. TaxID=2787631 RepID=UPI002ED7DDA9
MAKPVADYWRTNDENARESARHILREFVANNRQRKTRFELYLDGWIAPSLSQRLSIRRLRRVNPGYRITLRRTIRADVAESLGTRRTRLGFRVIVSVRKGVALAPFAFGAVERFRQLVPFPGSNAEVEEALTQSYPQSGVPSIRIPEEGERPVHGYLDSITESPRISDIDPGTWIAGLAKERPRELYELLDDASMVDTAQSVVAAIADADTDPEWADRFEMLAHGSIARRRSALRVVDVRRPTPAAAVVPGSARPLPVWAKEGAQLRAHAGRDRIPHVEQSWLHLTDALVQDGGTVLVGDSLIAYEPAADPALDFVAGQWDSVYGSQSRTSRALVRRRNLARRRHPEGILLSGRNDNNWYHWLIEYLPRAMQLDPSISDEVPFVVSERTPQAGIDALSSLSPRPVLRIDSRLAHRFDRLHVLAPPVQILDTTRVAWSRGLSMNPEPLAAVRRAWLGTDSRPPGKRIFLQRRSAHRGLVNEDDLIPIAEAHGLTVVDPGRLTWAQQVDLFSHAALVVGASGAVMANYLLMGQGSEVLAITSEQLHDFVLPAAIAQLNDVGFGYVLGAGTAGLRDYDSRNPWLHSDFLLPPQRFTRALRESIDRIGDRFGS